MTWPVGAMLLFIGACPQGWAPPPEPEIHTGLCSYGNGPYQPCNPGQMPAGTPQGSQWCIKQKEPKP